MPRKGKKKPSDIGEQQTRQTTAGQPPSGGASANPLQSTSSRQGTDQKSLSRDLGKLQIAYTPTTPSSVQAIPGPQPKQVLTQDVLEKLIWDKSGKGSFQNPYKDVNERKSHCGKAGRKVKIKTNHFSMDLKERHIFRYDVDFRMPWKRDIRRKDEPILIRAIEAMKTIKVKKTHLIQCNADRDTIVPDSFRNFRSSVLFLMVVKHCYPA